MKSRKGRQVAKTVTSYVLLLLLAFFFTFPFIWVLSTSFKSPEQNFGALLPSAISFENYDFIFKNVPIGQYFINTIIITVIGTLFNVFFSALAAYPLARYNFKGRDFIFYLVLLPMMIPAEGALIVNFITISNMQLFDTYLAVVLPSAVSIFGIFLMRQHYLSVPKDLEDAARIDGCNEFQVWWKVSFPMVKPATATVAIFSFTSFWNSFLWPLIILQSADKYPIQVALAQLNSAFEKNFRHLSAAIIIATIPILIFFFFFQKYFIEGYQGALKE